MVGGAQSNARLRAYLEEGIVHLIQKDGHTVCGREHLLQWCMRMKQLEHCPQTALSNTLADMLQEDKVVIGLRGAGEASQPNAPPQALAYAKVYAQECAVANAVAELMSECPYHEFGGRAETMRATLDKSFAAAGRCSPDDAQWAAIRGLFNSTLAQI